MNLSILKKNRFFDFVENNNTENLGFFFSFFLHLLILLCVIGLPNFFDSKPIYIPTIIPVEIINVSEVTTISKKITDLKSSELKKIEIKEKKFNSSINQEIKKIEVQDKPKIKNEEIKKIITPKEKIVIKEKKETLTKLQKEKIKVDTQKFENLPTKKIKLKLKPKQNLVSENQKQNKDVVVEAKSKPEQKPEFNIVSMLKDLRNEKTTQKVEGEDNKKEKIVTNNLNDDISDEIVQLSISEIDLVLQQLSRCFIAPLGAAIEKETFVKISAKIRQNRRVYENSIRIVDTNIDINNPFYGPITRSSMNTFLNPDCDPLKLPKDKYDVWKNITLTFDYRLMQGG